MVPAACDLPDPGHRIAILSGGGILGTIPVINAGGDGQLLAARLCRPPGDAPAPVAVIAHGLPPLGEERADMVPPSCSSPPAAWFLARGYVVMLALRRGYGDSEGEQAENPGSCASPDYVKSGLEGGRDLAAILAFTVKQPYAKPQGAVIAGEGAGGWAVLGYASQTHPVPAALIDFAGGWGGRAEGQLGHTCRPDLLIDAAAKFGATDHAPVLWVYPANDEVFPRTLVDGLFDAFVRAGGQAELVRPTSPAPNGHELLFEDQGPEIWGSLVDAFLAKQ